MYQKNHLSLSLNSSNIATRMDATYRKYTYHHNTRCRKPRSHGNLHNMYYIKGKQILWPCMHIQDNNVHLYNIILSQYLMKICIKLFGDKGINPVTTELHQLHDIKPVKHIVPEKWHRNRDMRL